MLLIALVAGLLVFAVQAVRTRGLLTSALWLAAVSAVTSVLLYVLGARLVAVVELSVGAGLVTVLFVFAINIAGDDVIDRKTVPPSALISASSVLFVISLGWFVWPGSISQPPAVAEPSLSVVIWQARGLDLLVQVVLIFSGVLGLLGLLAEAKAPLEGSFAQEIAAGRDREMQSMEAQVLQIEDVVR